jgi:hypothetical protein
MKFIARCFGLMAMSLVGCAADGRDDELSPAQSQDELSATSPVGMTITAALTVGVREALRTAMGEPTPPHDITDAVVAGVLVLRHRFSAEQLTLTLSEWRLGSRTEAGPVDVFTPPMERIELHFPSGGPNPASEAHVRAAAAAKKVFDAMKNAEEESTTVGGGGTVFVRHTASRAISCTFEPAHASFPERYECTIAVHAAGLSVSN